jgi:hypothetical protein
MPMIWGICPPPPTHSGLSSGPAHKLSIVETEPGVTEFSVRRFFC